MPGKASRKRNAPSSRPSSSTPPGSPPARRIRMTAAQSRELEIVLAHGNPPLSSRQEIANRMGLSVEQVSNWFTRRTRAQHSVRSTGESNNESEQPFYTCVAPTTSSRRGPRKPARQPETSSDDSSFREEEEDRPNEPQVDNSNQEGNAENEENANAVQVSAWFGRRPTQSLAVRRRETIIEPSETPNNDHSGDDPEERNENRSPLPSPGYNPYPDDERSRIAMLPEDQRGYRTRRRALSDHIHILAEQMSHINPTEEQPSTSLGVYDRFLIPNYRTTSVEETTQRIQDSTGTLQSLMPPISPEQSTSPGRTRTDNSRRIPEMSVYDRAAEISRHNAIEQEAAASTGRSSPHSPELNISPTRDRAVISLPASNWNEMVGTIQNINATRLSPLSRARREERRNPTSPIRAPVAIAVGNSPTAQSLIAQFMRQAYNNNNDANEPRAAPPTYVVQNVAREYLMPRGPPPMYTRPAPRTPRENVFTIPADVAIPQAVSDSFGPEGLKDDDDEEVTDIEEMVFQELLRKKMVCEICMTHMKQFRCSKCFYSMCKICTDTIAKEHVGHTPCPQCRKAHKQFLPIIVPRL